MRKMNSGIYSIQNTKNGKMYIGSSKSLNHRKSSHLCDLRSGRHRNYKLQKEFNKYGENSFFWTVLEFSESNKLIEREQFWLDTIKPEYNIMATANNHLYNHTESTKLAAIKRGEKLRGRKQSEEEKRMRSESFQKRWSDPTWRKNHKLKLKKTPEQKEILRQLATGERNGNWGKKRSKEFSELVSQANSTVQYVFVSPKGEEVEFLNLLGNGEKITGLPYWQLRQLYKGKKKECQGWTFKEATNLGYQKTK